MNGHNSQVIVSCTSSVHTAVEWLFLFLGILRQLLQRASAQEWKTLLTASLSSAASCDSLLNFLLREQASRLFSFIQN